MSGPAPLKDLVVLTADRNMEYALKGILSRTDSLGIRNLSVDYLVHPENDPGCLHRSHDFLKSFTRQYHYALVILDRDGCGQETKSRELLESAIEARLVDSGWEDRARAIVIDPELEAWIWSRSPQLDSILGWQGKSPDLRTWLHRKSFVADGQIKPADPKSALEQALRTVKKARSSSIYLNVAQRVSLDRCVDAAFNRLKQTLKQWFPAETRP